MNFPPESKLAPKVLKPTEIDMNGNTFSHVWNVVPPFIVDLTISRQFYSSAEKTYITGDLLVKEAATAELLSPFPEQPSETIQRLFSRFSAPLAHCSISYYPYGTGGPTERFVEMVMPILDELKPFDLFQRFGKWKLEQLAADATIQ